MPYVVIESTPGYMPDADELATFESLEDARVYASDELSRLLDHLAYCEDDPEAAFAALSIAGSFQEDLSVYVTGTRRAHDLGRVIEILEVEREQYAGAEPHETMVAGYVYRADTYCPDCTLSLVLADMGLEGHGLSYIPSEAIDRLGISSLGGAVYRGGEHGWDSDTFPKVILRPHGETLECGKCGCSL